MRTALFILVLVLLGCRSYSIRDAAVYEAEIDFIVASASDTVKHGVAAINKFCSCEGGEWATEECADLAETVVVLKYRAKYHAAFMLYLGGISNRQPPKEAPEIPDSTDLCPKGGE